MTKEALKLALEALTNAYWPTESDLMPAHNIKECADAITAIKEALAQPEQEPVADHFDCGTYLGSHIGKEIKHRIENYSPPQRTWVGLTNEERADCWETIPELAMKKVEAKLKEKNA